MKNSTNSFLYLGGCACGESYAVPTTSAGNEDDLRLIIRATWNCKKCYQYLYDDDFKTREVQVVHVETHAALDARVSFWELIYRTEKGAYESPLSIPQGEWETCPPPRGLWL